MKACSPLTLAAVVFGLIASASSTVAQDENEGIILQLLDPTKGGRYERATDPGKRMPAMQRIDAGLTPYRYEGVGVNVREEVSTNVLSFHIIKVERLWKLRAGHGLAPNPAKAAKDAGTVKE